MSYGIFERIRHPRRAVRGAGFTLVELMVVIGIIATLIAFLLPTLKRARYSAMRTVDMSNMRQISIAAFMYANEFKGWFPITGDVMGPNIYNPSPGYQNNIWPLWTMFGGMDDYFTKRYKLQKVKQCPFMTWDHVWTSPFGFWLPIATPTSSDWGYNVWMGRGYHRSDFWNEFLGPQKVKSKIRKVMVSDIVYKSLNDGNSIGYGWFNPHDQTEQVGMDGSVTAPRIDMTVAYTDGTVINLKPTQISYTFYGYVNWYADGPMTAKE